MYTRALLAAYFGPTCHCSTHAPKGEAQPPIVNSQLSIVNSASASSDDKFQSAYNSLDLDRLARKAMRRYYEQGTGSTAVHNGLTLAQAELIWDRVSDALPKDWQQLASTGNPLYNELRYNTYKYTYFKNASMAEELKGLLTDAGGNVRSWSDFKAMANPIVKDYNQLWLRAEYNAHVASAQMAAKWETLREADLLEYVAVQDDRTRDTHRILHGIILPPGHAFWRTYYPPNGWNCRCTVIRARSGATQVQPPAGLSPEVVPPVFRNHPAFTGELVNIQSSPYVEKAGTNVIAGAFARALQRRGIIDAQEAIKRASLYLDYVEQGYVDVELSAGSKGYLLADAKILSNEDDIKNTIPLAKLYANRGDIVILKKPKVVVNGKEEASPDGLLNKEDAPIEFKNCTTGTEKNFKNNLKLAGKNAATTRRSLQITDDADLFVIANVINGHYNASNRLDLLDIIYKERIIEFSREFYQLNAPDSFKAILDKLK